jgi:hypothetical protein
MNKFIIHAKITWEILKAAFTHPNTSTVIHYDATYKNTKVWTEQA